MLNFGKSLKCKILFCSIPVLLFSLAVVGGCDEVCNHPEQYHKTTILEATCGSDGKETVTCTKCGVEIKETIIPATGDHTKDEGVVTKLPTCKEMGETSYHCTTCGVDLGTEENVPTTDCVKDEGKIIEESTCEKAGKIQYHCVICEKEWTEDAPLKPHDYSVPNNYWEVNGYLAPTETHCAIIPYYCKTCKNLFTKEYSDADFSFAKDVIRMEDKYSTDTPIVFDAENKYLTINLTGSDTEKTLQALATEKLYNTDTKVFTVPAVYKTVALEKVKVRGFKTPNNDFAITTEVCHQLHLILENLSYTAPTGLVGLDLKNVNEALVETSGLVAINGGQNGKEGIAANNLEIVGSGSLTVKGGNGLNGNSFSGNGTAGGAGLKAAKLTLSVNGSVNITGGDGGAAYNRPTGDNGGDGSDGKSGYDGGNGGNGILADNLIMTAGQYTIVGGNGARGGDGSECNRKETTWNGSDNVTGGRGGNGGAGADAIQAGEVQITSGTLSAIGGNGGDSGKPGGCHDDDHSDWVFGVGTTTATDGSTGTAGKGGKGLSENCTIEGDDNLVTTRQGANGNTTRELNQC